jgi:hypothetical protein
MIHSNGSNEGTQDNQVQGENNSVNMENNKTKRKKKQDEKDTYCPDAQENEVIAERTSSAYKKRIEDEIIEQGKRINYHNTSFPAICYKSEML